MLAAQLPRPKRRAAGGCVLGEGVGRESEAQIAAAACRAELGEFTERYQFNTRSYLSSRFLSADQRIIPFLGCVPSAPICSSRCYMLNMKHRKKPTTPAIPCAITLALRSSILGTLPAVGGLPGPNSSTTPMAK